jgi:hypothetical protein
MTDPANREDIVRALRRDNVSLVTTPKPMRFGRNVRFQRRDRVDGVTRKEDGEGCRHVYCTYFICVKPG